MDSLEKYHQLLEDLNEGLNDAYTRLDVVEHKQKTTILMVSAVGAICAMEGFGIFMVMKAVQNLSQGLATIAEFSKNHAESTGFIPGQSQSNVAPANQPRGPRQNLQPREATVQPQTDMGDDLFTPAPEAARTVRQVFSARNGAADTEVPAPVSEPIETPASATPDWAALALSEERIDPHDRDNLV